MPKVIQVKTPEVIARHWEQFREYILAALPVWSDRSDVAALSILDRLLDGSMQLWLLVRDGAKFEISAVATTQIITNQATGTKTLEIFSLYGIRHPSEEDWRKSLEVLGNYARMHQCSRIIAQTQNPRVVELAKQFGFNTDIRLLALEVE